MNNSHLDSNISLGLNILDGCLTANSSPAVGHKGFGRDITEDNVDDMLKCAFMTAGALKDLGARNCYYQMAPLYYFDLEAAGKVPSYWDSVRMLHLLPKYVGNHTKAGEWPLPAAFIKDSVRIPMIEKRLPTIEYEYGYTYSRPLSYVPEIDKYWLGDSAIDVFGILGKPLGEFLGDLYHGGEEGFTFPTADGHFKRWIEYKMGREGNPVDWKVPAILFLLVFFPFRLTSTFMKKEKPTTSVDWLLRLLGDEDCITYKHKLTLLNYGPAAIRNWTDVASLEVDADGSAGQ